MSSLPDHVIVGDLKGMCVNVCVWIPGEQMSRKKYTEVRSQVSVKWISICSLPQSK